MKTELKNLEKCQVQLTVTLDAAEAKDCIKKVENGFVRAAQLPGFRKGKVPLALIRKEFADSLKQEIEREIFTKNYPEAVKAEALEEVAPVDVKDMKYGEDGASFAVIVDVKPKFKLPTYKGLKISKNDTAVKDDEVAKQVENLRAAYAKYEDAKEGEAVAEGDFVQIDYEGSIGGKKIVEINPEAKFAGKGEGFWTQVEEGRFLPEILEAVKGMKAGETKENVKAKFDKEAAPDGLKGEKAVYTVTLKSFRRRILPTDAEFAEKAKSESFEKLVATVREQMEKQSLQQEAARRENEAVELMLKKASFDVPQSQVRRAMDGYLNELAQRAQYSGLDASYFEKNRDQILKDAEESATKQVRLWYIIDEIAKAENIEAKDEEKGKKVIEFVLANAK
jgi:trigger factor